MNDQITVKDMLAYMQSGLSFSLSYVSYDSQRKKGGKVLHVHEAKLLGADKEEVPARTRTRHEDNMYRLNEIKQGRDPRHMKWYTRNINIYQDGAPTSLVKKIHPPLVTIFNNQIVVA